MTLSCRTCGGHDVELEDSNGITDPANGNRRETFECHTCAATFTMVLRA